MHDDDHLFLFGYSLGFLLLLSVGRGLYVFLRKGNPCDVVFVVGCTVSLGILWNHGPELIDTTLNRINITTTANYPVPTLAQNQFHQSLHVVDMHADSLLWTHRNLLQRSTAGHVDMVRLLEGNVAIQAFTIVTKSPQRMNFHKNTNTTDSILMLGFVQQWSPALLFKGGQKLINRAIYQCQQLKRFVKASDKQLHLITSKHDLQHYLSYRSTHPNTTAGFLGIEGMHALEGKLQNVDVLYDHGVRMMSPVHFFDNRLGGSAHGEEKYGLTAFGKQVIRKMENKSMLLDVAHSSIALLDDILLFAERPIIVSHTGVVGTCNNSRNLLDKHIERIALSGGLVSIAYFDQAVCGTSVEHIVNAIKHVRDLVGIEYVGLGSDFDGTVTVGFDTSKLNYITSYLLNDASFTKEDIRKVMGGNAIRLLKLLLPDK